MRRVKFRKVFWLVLLGLMFTLIPVPAALAQSKKGSTAVPSAKAAVTGAKVDINNATQKELEDLPGVGAATAKKIITGRPYTSVDDLAKAGVPKTTIAKITPLVMVGAATAAKSSPVVPTPVSASTRTAPPAKIAPTGKVDINNATEKELEDLPGVGPATAKKIIAGRPYTSADDLGKAGVPKNTIAKITPLVMVGATAAAGPAPVVRKAEAKAAPTLVPTPTPVAPTAAPAAKPAPAAQASYTPPPAAGMVWVNLESKVYHKEGDRWYGKTKNGKYMTEADAIKAGYRAVKVREAK